MPYLVNQSYNDGLTELTEPETELIKTIITPVVSGGLYFFSLVYTALGRVIIEYEKPDGAGVVIISQSSTSHKNHEKTFNFSATYNGTGTQWLFKARRYSAVQDTPRPQAEIHNISMVDNTVLGFNPIEPLLLLEETLTPLWGSLEVADLWFEIPSGAVVDNVADPDPTSQNLITGNIKKLDLPFKANVVAVSLGLDPKVLAKTISNETTGDYTIDVYPHTDEVLLYVAPEYGVAFQADFPMATGQIVHPTTPNKFVYVAQDEGVLPSTEPVWVTEGQFNAGGVTLLAVPLHRPLMNGFVKPSIVPI